MLNFHQQIVDDVKYKEGTNELTEFGAILNLIHNENYNSPKYPNTKNYQNIEYNIVWGDEDSPSWKKYIIKFKKQKVNKLSVDTYLNDERFMLFKKLCSHIRFININIAYHSFTQNCDVIIIIKRIDLLLTNLTTMQFTFETYDHSNNFECTLFKNSNNKVKNIILNFLNLWEAQLTLNIFHVPNSVKLFKIISFSNSARHGNNKLIFFPNSINYIHNCSFRFISPYNLKYLYCDNILHVKKLNKNLKYLISNEQINFINKKTKKKLNIDILFLQKSYCRNIICHQYVNQPCKYYLDDITHNKLLLL